MHLEPGIRQSTLWLLDRVRERIRLRHYNSQIEKCQGALRELAEDLNNEVVVLRRQLPSTIRAPGTASQSNAGRTSMQAPVRSGPAVPFRPLLAHTEALITPD